MDIAMVSPVPRNWSEYEALRQTEYHTQFPPLSQFRNTNII